MKIAVVGVTGLVGREILTVIQELQIIPELFIPVASTRSYGKTVELYGKSYAVKSHEAAIESVPDFAIFSAGAEASREWAPKYAAAGITVIDNSSAWRTYNEVPLIVPEINGTILTDRDKIISNPNCSTIQMVLALAPLHRKYKILRIVVSTYQSVTGSGAKGLLQLENERKGIKGKMAYPYPIDLNIIPHGGDFQPDGYTTEEIKLVNETRKILCDNSIRVTATVVRVPVYGGHSESVNIEFENDYNLDEIRNLIANTPGITIEDDPANNIYPMPLFAKGKNDVFVGRIRRDSSNKNSLNLFIVSDNLRKGAATNAVQIAVFADRLINKHS